MLVEFLQKKELAVFGITEWAKTKNAQKSK
jgi:hypothetical protein